MRTSRLTLLAGAVSALAIFASPASAELIFQGPIDLKGTGLGNVDTILTMTSHGSGSSESGKVSWNGSANIVTADPNPPGFTAAGSTDMTGINHTITMSQTGWTSGQGLGIVFNPAEPGPLGGTANMITLNYLEMTIYDDSTGNVLFTAPWTGGPLTLAAVDPGTGNSGYLFDLDQAETNGLNNVAGLSSTDRIGLLAYATDAQGGQETFFGTVIGTPRCTDCTPTPFSTTPEPASLFILGGALVATGLVRRKKARA